MNNDMIVDSYISSINSMCEAYEMRPIEAYEYKVMILEQTLRNLVKEGSIETVELIIEQIKHLNKLTCGYKSTYNEKMVT